MELLAQGRDCDIFDYGDGTVLRRSRKAYDQTQEARVLAHVAEHGYPVPKVHELLDDGRDLVMEKVAGPTMLQAIERRPWKVASFGRQLAELHIALHAIPPLDGLPALHEGEALVHLDLHPQNVILSPDGPVVIDWTNASRGLPGHDTARVWALMATADANVGRPLRLVLAQVRRRLVNAFVDAAGRAEAKACLPYAVELTLLDPNICDAEKARMQALVTAETG